MLATLALDVLSHIGTDTVIGISTAVGIFVTGILVKANADRIPVSDVVIDRTGDALMMAGFVVFAIEIVLVSCVIVGSSATPAPDQWLRHLPVQEAQYFKKRMHHIITIDAFAVMEQNYMEKSYVHNLHISVEQQQKQALTYSDHTTRVQLKKD